MNKRSFDIGQSNSTLEFEDHYKQKSNSSLPDQKLVIGRCEHCEARLNHMQQFLKMLWRELHDKIFSTFFLRSAEVSLKIS